MRSLSRRQWAIVGAAAAAVAVIVVVVAFAMNGGNAAPKPLASDTPTPTPSATTSTKPKPVATCPLTGRRPSKGQKIDRPALAVKIDNVDLGRPQSGVNRADIVFEETVEGGLTRLFAIFQCDSADTVGPVRSARTSDAGLLRLMSDPILGFSGSNSRVAARLAAASGAVLLSYDAYGSLYHRSSSRPAPHNVYTSTSALVKAGLGRKHSLKAPEPIFTYLTAAPKGPRVKEVNLRWSGYASAGWGWTGHAWNRTQNGTPDVVATGRRISAENVVVMRIKSRYTGLHDVLGNASPDDVVTGSGKVWVFRNGVVVHGTWKRPHLWSPMRLLDRKGRVIKLAQGRTWVELLPRPGTLRFH